jgi:hypothetical protein
MLTLTVLLYSSVLEYTAVPDMDIVSCTYVSYLATTST